MFLCCRSSAAVREDSSSNKEGFFSNTISGSISSADGSCAADDMREWRQFSTVKEATDYYSRMPYAPRTLSPHHVEMLTILDIDL